MKTKWYIVKTINLFSMFLWMFKTLRRKLQNLYTHHEFKHLDLHSKRWNSSRLMDESSCTTSSQLFRNLNYIFEIWKIYRSDWNRESILNPSVSLKLTKASIYWAFWSPWCLCPIWRWDHESKPTQKHNYAQQKWYSGFLQLWNLTSNSKESQHKLRGKSTQIHVS